MIERHFKLVGRAHVVLLLSVVYAILGFEISHLEFLSAILKRKCILIELLNLLVLGLVHRRGQDWAHGHVSEVFIELDKSPCQLLGLLLG